MTTGELDYNELYHQEEGAEELAFPPASFYLWIVFLVLMPVLLNNLLVHALLHSCRKPQNGGGGGGGGGGEGGGCVGIPSNL